MMITRSNLAEQLREYQIRSKHDWASVSFFSSTSNLTSTASRADVVIFVICELVILALLVFSVVSLYFRHLKLAFILVSGSLLLLVCVTIAKQVTEARKKKRRMLLPLSMQKCVNGESPSQFLNLISRRVIQSFFFFFSDILLTQVIEVESS